MCLHMSFQHNGTPPHYRREVRQWLSENYPGRWTARICEAPISWPSRSPDWNPPDFVLWMYLETKVYASTVVTIEGLWRQTI
jgi:hypothetical protein